MSGHPDIPSAPWNVERSEIRPFTTKQTVGDRGSVRVGDNPTRKSGGRGFETIVAAVA
jgi:hypothetical protein